MLIFLAITALQAAPLPPEFVAQGRALARDSVAAEFCASVGWDTNGAVATAALADDVEAASTRYGVAPDQARAAVLEATRVAALTLRAETAPPAPDPAARRAFIDRLQAVEQRECPTLARRRPTFFRSDVATNQARVSQIFAGLRNPPAH